MSVTYRQTKPMLEVLADLKRNTLYVFIVGQF